jgi:hypothetical protein
LIEIHQPCTPLHHPDTRGVKTGDHRDFGEVTTSVVAKHALGFAVKVGYKQLGQTGARDVFATAVQENEVGADIIGYIEVDLPVIVQIGSDDSLAAAVSPIKPQRR